MTTKTTKISCNKFCRGKRREAKGKNEVEGNKSDLYVCNRNVTQLQSKDHAETKRGRGLCGGEECKRGIS